MINTHLVSALLLGTALMFSPLAAATPALALSEDLAAYVGPEPTLFDSPEAAIAAFKQVMAKGDAGAISALLGLDAAKVEKAPDDWGLAGTTRDARVAALHAAEQRLDWLSVTEALDLALELGEVFKTVTGWGPDHARASQRRANVEMLRGMARHYEEITAADHAPATIGGFLNWCAAQAEAEEDNKAWASGSAAVQVLTYHKAKGLEWPVVVCWDLDGEPRERWFSVRVLGNETSPLSLERPLAERRIALWANPFGPKSARNPLLDKLKASAAGQQEIRHSRNEDLRLLYVGITRARDRLVLVQLADKPDADKNLAVQLLKLVAPADVATDFENRLRAGGLGYGDLKKALFEHYWQHFAAARARRAELAAHPDHVRQILRSGAEKARAVATKVLDRAKSASGLR